MSSGRTLRHIALAALLRERAPPGFSVIPEVTLATEPQRADFLLLRHDTAIRRDDEARTLKRLWPLLPSDTLIEYKSPSRPVRRGDVTRLLGYGAQYFTLESERLRQTQDLALVLMVASITPTLDRELDMVGWRREELGGGYFRLDSRPFPGLLVVVDDVSAVEHDESLNLVGHRTMASSSADAWLTINAAYGKEASEMENFEDYQELLGEAVKKLPLWLRLDGIPPEDRLKDLTPAQRILVLDDDVLRSLPSDFIDSQPPEVRDAIRRRLAH